MMFWASTNKNKFASGCVAAIAGLLTLGTAWAQTAVDYPIPNKAQSGLIGPAVASDGALWFLEPNIAKFGRMTVDGTVTLFNGTTGIMTGFVAGPDGGLWVTESSEIGRIATDGTVKEFPLSDAGATAYGITVGRDGNLWFLETKPPSTLGGSSVSHVGRITPAGVITEFSIADIPSPYGALVSAPDGALWFPLQSPANASRVGRMNTSGAYTTFPLSTSMDRDAKLTVGADGALWFSGVEGAIGHLALDGTVTTFAFPQSAIGYTTADIVAGADGALWTTAYSQFATSVRAPFRLTVDGTFTSVSASTGRDDGVLGPDGNLWSQSDDGLSKVAPTAYPTPLVSAALPTTRSVRTGATATAFVTMINTGTAAATGCAIVSQSPVAAGFTYQTTDAATNMLTGTANMPVTIAAGASQTFLVAFATDAPFVTQTQLLGYSCAGIPAAATVAGLNTLGLSASDTPVADLIAMVASGVPGTVVPPIGGIGVFAVATANIGAAATITATATTGAVSLPVAVTLCQTNPTTGACLAAPAASVTTTIANGATPTFGVFVEASQAIAFDPANSRVVVRFTDGSGVLRGATSVAVRTP